MLKGKATNNGAGEIAVHELLLLIYDKLHLLLHKANQQESYGFFKSHLATRLDKSFNFQEENIMIIQQN